MRKKVLAREVNFVYVSTKEKVTYIFTKALGIDKLHKFMTFLGILEMDLSLRENVEISSSTLDVSLG